MAARYICVSEFHIDVSGDGFIPQGHKSVNERDTIWNLEYHGNGHSAVKLMVECVLLISSTKVISASSPWLQIAKISINVVPPDKGLLIGIIMMARSSIHKILIIMI